MIFVLLAPGFEEIEAITPLDILRRANLAVQPIAVTDTPKDMLVTGAHGLSVQCNCHIEEADLNCPELLILPGGMTGTINLSKNQKVRDGLISRMNDAQPIGAICAAPIILGELGLLKGKKAICYPGLEDKLIGAHIIQEDVVRDATLITSRGPATAMAFSLELLKMLTDEPTAGQVAKELLTKI